MRFSRSDTISRLSSQEETFDFLVIGGGATGLGAALDAAARGHRVALIEQADFAKGTSSRSTKLVHGGVRYLKQGNIALVREALRERSLLHANAPHLVHDMTFVIPNYKWRDQALYAVGMKMYDGLAGRRNFGRSAILNAAETRALIPTVEPAGLVGGVSYHDGQFDDARLAVNLAQTAGKLGAAVANYVRAVGLVKEGGFVTGVEAEDVESGRQFVIRAKCVINATGVFVDALRRMDEPEAPPLVAVSQGIHLVLPREFLPGDTALMIPKTADGRVIFAIPWHGHVVAGTTDTPVSAASLEPRAMEEEKEFVMAHAAKYLSKAPSASDVRSIFCGLRPLVKNAGTAKTSELSRDQTILMSPSRLLTITGGKWTTYRRMAQDVINQAERAAGLEARACETAHFPIHGWTRQPDAQAHLQAYGSDASAIHDLIARNPALSQPLHPDLPFQEAEVLWHVRNEMARTVEDVLARRLRMLLLNARASKEAAPRVAAIMAGELQRDEKWISAQVAAYHRLADGYVFGHCRARSDGRQS